MNNSSFLAENFTIANNLSFEGFPDGNCTMKKNLTFEELPDANFTMKNNLTFEEFPDGNLTMERDLTFEELLKLLGLPPPDLYYFIPAPEDPMLVFFIITGILLSIILPSNIVLVRIWIGWRRRCQLSLLLTVVAICNTFVVMIDVVNHIVYFLDFKGNRCLYVIASNGFEEGFHSCTRFMTTYIALQRFAICAFPFNGPRIFRGKTTIVFLVLSTIYLIYQTSNSFFLLEDIKTVWIPADVNRHLCLGYFKVSDLEYNEIVTGGVMFQLGINKISTSIIVAFCMSGCLYTLTCNRMKYRQSERSKKAKTRTTRMLIAMMFLFVLGELPTTTLQFMEVFEVPLESFSAWYLSGFSKVALAVSVAGNSGVFVGMSRQYRNDIKELICSKRKPSLTHYERSTRKENASSVSTVTVDI